MAELDGGEKPHGGYTYFISWRFPTLWRPRTAHRAVRSESLCPPARFEAAAPPLLALTHA